MADATGGDPSSHAFQFFPHLASALLEQADSVCSIWPAFADLRAAAHATKQSRLRTVISAAVCEARLVFTAAFFVAHGAPRPTWPCATASGQTLFRWIQALLFHGSDLLQSRWRWSPEQARLLYAQLSLVVSPSRWTALPVTSAAVCADSISWNTPPRPYPAALCAFLHTLRIGAPWQHALHFFADLPLGHFSACGRIFATLALLHSAPDRCVPLAAPDDPDALTLFFAKSALVAIASSQSLLPRNAPTPSSGLVTSARGTVFASRFMPP
jgi:hypothetical protein